MTELDTSCREYSMYLTVDSGFTASVVNSSFVSQEDGWER